MSSETPRPAFYALPSGGWRDYWTLLHPPYTVWHLSYVTIGAALAPDVNVRWWLETMLAFFLAMGVAAHALDELHGRPLGTGIPDARAEGPRDRRSRGSRRAGGGRRPRGHALDLGADPGGGFLVVAYNLELFGGAFHSDLWFALAWGAFPVVTAYVAQTGSLDASAVIAAAACTALSAGQRALSTPVRRLRRHTASVSGTIVADDGSATPLDASALRAAPERGAAAPIGRDAVARRRVDPAEAAALSVGQDREDLVGVAVELGGPDAGDRREIGPVARLLLGDLRERLVVEHDVGGDAVGSGSLAPPFA